jgi:hypothetical protein
LKEIPKNRTRWCGNTKFSSVHVNCLGLLALPLRLAGFFVMWREVQYEHVNAGWVGDNESCTFHAKKLIMLCYGLCSLALPL